MGIFRKKLVKLAVIQMKVFNEKHLNLECAFRFINEAIEQGARIICLPQAFATGISWIDLKNTAEEIPEGNLFRLLQKKADAAGIYIAAGILEKDEEDIFDSAILLNPEGKLLGKYRRRFLWEGEIDFISRGKESKCICTPMGKIGFIIGYDINFPEACREYFKQQVDLLICVATIFDDFSYPTEYICRVRAMENHCYFAFASGLGEHELANKKYMGRSLIACDPIFLLKQVHGCQTPDRDILCKAEKNEGILIQELLLEELKKFRKGIPHYKDLDVTLKNESCEKKSCLQG